MNRFLGRWVKVLVGLGLLLLMFDVMSFRVAVAGYKGEGDIRILSNFRPFRGYEIRIAIDEAGGKKDVSIDGLPEIGRSLEVFFFLNDGRCPVSFSLFDSGGMKIVVRDAAMVESEYSMSDGTVVKGFYSQKINAAISALSSMAQRIVVEGLSACSNGEAVTEMAIVSGGWI